MKYQISHDTRIFRWTKGSEEVLRYRVQPMEVELSGVELDALSHGSFLFLALNATEITESTIYLAPTRREAGDTELNADASDFRVENPALFYYFVD